VSRSIPSPHCITDIGHWVSANRLQLNKEKTELLWVGSRYNLSALEGCGPLRLDAGTVEAKDHFRVLGVTFSADLTLDRHVSNISAGCFYRLRQLRRVRRPLDSGSVVTLVHALVTSRIDYCNAVHAESPKATTDKLQRVLNAAARVVTATQKYDRGLTRIMRDELHWLSMPQRVRFKLGTMMHRCLHNYAPRYLCDYCIPVANVAARSQLRSASRHQVVVPRYNTSTFGRRAFSVAGPTVWNSLPDKLRDQPLSIDSFRRQLKTFLFAD